MTNDTDRENGPEPGGDLAGGRPLAESLTTTLSHRAEGWGAVRANIRCVTPLWRSRPHWHRSSQAKLEITSPSGRRRPG